LDIGPALRVGRGEGRSGGQEKASLLADAFEAIVAAIYLDGDFAAAFDFVRRELGGTLQAISASGAAKTELQQRCPKSAGRLPAYRVGAERGAEHDRTDAVEVRLEDELLGSGSRKSKKIAEHAAAKAAVEQLKLR